MSIKLLGTMPVLSLDTPLPIMKQITMEVDMIPYIIGDSAFGAWYTYYKGESGGKKVLAQQNSVLSVSTTVGNSEKQSFCGITYATFTANETTSFKNVKINHDTTTNSHGFYIDGHLLASGKNTGKQAIPAGIDSFFGDNQSELIIKNLSITGILEDGSKWHCYWPLTNDGVGIGPNAVNLTILGVADTDYSWVV